MVPSRLANLISELERNPRPLTSLRLVFSSGEALSQTLALEFHRWFGSEVELVNSYGTTESTLTSTWFRVPPDPHGRVPVWHSDRQHNCRGLR